MKQILLMFQMTVCISDIFKGKFCIKICGEISWLAEVCALWGLHCGGVSACLFHRQASEAGNLLVRRKKRKRGREEGDKIGGGWGEWIREEATSHCWHLLSTSPDKYAKLTRARTLVVGVKLPSLSTHPLSPPSWTSVHFIHFRSCLACSSSP